MNPMSIFLDIINSPGTLTVVTAVVSLVAVYLYQKQKHDRVKEAAGVILAEIIRAEDRIPDAKKSLASTKKNPSSANRVQIITTNSWQTSQHLLSRALPDDVTRSISDFYANCTLLDELLAYIYLAFRENIAEVRRNNFRINADYLKEKIDSVKSNPTSDIKISETNYKTEALIESRRNKFTEIYPTSTSYYPTKPADDAQIYLDLINDNLSQTRVGEKLRLIQHGYISSKLRSKSK